MYPEHWVSVYFCTYDTSCTRYFSFIIFASATETVVTIMDSDCTNVYTQGINCYFYAYIENLLLETRILLCENYCNSLGAAMIELHMVDFLIEASLGVP